MPGGSSRNAAAWSIAPVVVDPQAHAGRPRRRRASAAGTNGFPDLPGIVVGEQITERGGVAPVHGVGEPGREVADLGINRERSMVCSKLVFISLLFCVRCPGG